MNIHKILKIVSKYGPKFSYFDYLHKIYDESCRPVGSVRAVIEEDGRSWVAHEKHNLIVNDARPAQAHLLAEADSDYQATIFKIGTKGHDLGPPEDTDSPIAPTMTDSSLIDTSPFSKAIGSFSYLPVVNPTSVQFVTSIEKTEANGAGSVIYTEAGLFLTNGDMFARETFKGITKTASRKVTFYWQILY